MNYDAIPPTLRNLKRWIPWRWGVLKGKRTKRPGYLVDNHWQYSGWQRPDAWAEFDTVERQNRLHSTAAGLGFVLTDLKNDDGLNVVAIDFDNCYDGENIDDGIRWWVERLNSYTEVSPSGKGLRVFAKAQSNGWPRGKVSTKGIEVFYGSGFVTVTGKRVKEYPSTVQDRDEVLQSLMDSIQPDRMADNPKIGLHKSNFKSLVTRRILVKELVDCIDEFQADTYDDWIAVGMAIQHALKDSPYEALDIWQRWSESSGKYDEDVCRDKWASFDPENNKGYTIGTLFKWGIDGGWTPAKSIVQPTPAAEADTGNAARELIDGHQIEGVPSLFYWNGQFVVFQDGRYRFMEEKASHSYLATQLAGRYSRVMDSFTKSVASLACESTPAKNSLPHIGSTKANRPTTFTKPSFVQTES